MQEIEAPIDRVTLFEDRAYVCRRARLELEAGVARLRIPGVTTVLADKTLIGKTGATARVVDVRMRRWLPEPEVVKGEKVDHRPELVRLERELSLLDGELQAAERVRAQTLQELMREAGRGESNAKRWQKELEGLDEWTSELREQKLDLHQRQIDLQTRKSPVYRAPKQPPVQGAILVELEVSRSGPVELTVEYCVPGACWRPYHSASLNAAEDEVCFRCDGCLWQHTGEDWNQVELLFSTQRPSLGVEPPNLGSDLLRTQKKTSEVVVAERDEEVMELSLNAQELPRPQKALEVPGIDDSGEVVNLQAPGRHSVVSDGQPVRVELFSFRSSTTLERVLLAELNQDVMLKTVLENCGRHPILAGPIDLIRDQGLLGRSSVLYVGVGETFTLGWGPDPYLRAQRHETAGKETKANLTGGWRQVEHAVKLTLSNLGQEPRRLKVTERIPVSEVKEVEIVCQAEKPDENGFIHWEIELGPRGRKELELSYVLKRRKDVVGVT